MEAGRLCALSLENPPYYCGVEGRQLPAPPCPAVQVWTSWGGLSCRAPSAEGWGRELKEDEEDACAQAPACSHSLASQQSAVVLKTSLRREGRRRKRNRRGAEERERLHSVVCLWLPLFDLLPGKPGRSGQAAAKLWRAELGGMLDGAGEHACTVWARRCAPTRACFTTACVSLVGGFRASALRRKACSVPARRRAPLVIPCLYQC